MQEPDILERICRSAPFSGPDEARRALHATLAALGEQLSDDERALLAGDLPDELGRHLEVARRQVTPGAATLFRRVARREGTRIGIAVEHAEVVLQALGEVLSRSTVRRLNVHVPELGGLFAPPEAYAAPPPPSRPAAPRGHRHSVARNDDPHSDTRLSSAHGLEQEREQRTLATGSPGSTRPLAGSRDE
jgi:uncharacterized protein (DUF2267 family)